MPLPLIALALAGWALSKALDNDDEEGGEEGGHPSSQEPGGWEWPEVEPSELPDIRRARYPEPIKRRPNNLV